LLFGNGAFVFPSVGVVRLKLSFPVRKICN